MASEDDWRDVMLEELAAPKRNALVGGPFGSDLVTSDYSLSGVPVIRGENLSSGRWVGGEFVFVPPEKARQLAANTAGPLDIVFTQRGANHYRQVALVPAIPERRYVISQSQMKLTVDLKKADALFLYYLFRSPIQQEYLQRNAIQTGVPHTNLSILRKTPLRVPSLAIQRAIAHILGTLDDKIELNRRMNETLEAMARALFKSWFVDKVQGGLPKDWRDGKMDELFTLCRDTISPSQFPTETFDHYSIPAFDEGRLAKVETGEQILSNKFLVPPNAIMISKLNPRIPRVWLPQISNLPRSVSSTEFLVAVGKHGISREWLYGLFSSDGFLDQFATFVTGTSGSHQRVKPEYLLAMDVDIPPEERITAYTDLAKPLLDRIALNRTESRTIAALRDALLPKLISGELRVNDAKPFIRRAV